MKRFVALLAAVGIVWSVTGASAQSLPSAKPEQVGLSQQRLERVGQMFKAQIARERFPGAVAMIVRKGKVAYFEAFGQRDPASGAPMTKDAIFRLYSMTKPFASVAAMILVEEGKLTLADPVSKHLPQLTKLQVAVPKTGADGKTTYTLVPAEREMTVQDLLRHTSGLVYSNNTPNEHVKQAYLANKVDWRDATPAEQIERLAKVPLAHQPGTAWEYSLSTDVLGRVVEAASGMTLGAFLSERVFAPLKMTDTGFLVPKQKVARLAQPFAKDKETGKPIELLDVTVAQKNDAGGAGSASTTMDYARFLQMLANGGQLDGVRLLSRTSVALMTSDHLGARIQAAVTPGELLMGVPGYTFGLGFMVRQGPGIAGVPGSQGEFAWAGALGTFFWVDPKEDLAVVYMSQAGGPTRPYYRRLIKALVAQALGD